MKVINYLSMLQGHPCGRVMIDVDIRNIDELSIEKFKVNRKIQKFSEFKIKSATCNPPGLLRLYTVPNSFHKL